MKKYLGSVPNYFRLVVVAGLFAVPTGALRASCCHTGYYGEVCIMCVGDLCLYGGPGAGDITVMSPEEAAATEDLCQLLNTLVLAK
jgi:hypothetical protein